MIENIGLANPFESGMKLPEWETIIFVDFSSHFAQFYPFRKHENLVFIL